MAKRIKWNSIYTCLDSKVYGPSDKITGYWYFTKVTRNYAEFQLIIKIFVQ